jgi:hypothetical protein
MNLEDCKRELSNILRELRDIEWGVRHDFIGIGEGLCGDCIDKIADKYDEVSRDLKKINYNSIAAAIESELKESSI